MSTLLQGINSPDDIKKMNDEQLYQLADEIRKFLIEKVSRTGGHLASNLGIVELTLALHKVFNTPEDKIIWDVGHQSYVHKILTGRKDKFDTIRQMGGLSGFPKVNESAHDCFNTGHSSTSISAALGMARARDLKNEKYSVIAVIGDGALTGGMSFEALNHAGMSSNNLIVILNDNEMSIAHNVGGLSKYLNKIRTQPIYFKVKEDLDFILNKIPGIGKSALKALSKVKVSIKYLMVPGILFEELGFKYLGPIDGHNLQELINVLRLAKTIKGPILIHVCTQKGRGYTFAEENPHVFHGISPFEVETGEVKVCNGPSYSDIFGEELVRLAKEDERICAVTAAMPHGTGLDKFSKIFPERFFDVGIAEQHAVTFSAGLARNGMKPVVAIYSSFLQRSYDQILHDVALQNLHVIFAVDRAGIVGEDGETHQGIYDLSYLGHIPNLILMAPCDYDELRKMLRFALYENCGPVAIRYPRGNGKEKLGDTQSISYGCGVRMAEGSDISVIAAGNMVETALKSAELLKKSGYTADIINVRFIKPLDAKLIMGSAMKTGKIVTLEDNIIKGGLGSSVLELINSEGLNIKTRLLGFPDKFIEHGKRQELYKKYGLDPESVAEEMLRFINEIENRRE